ncbi:MAG: Fe2+-dependent dioxygenase [Saprospiraceae bacterium]|nr:Fe2+-dependent dioxygenase [Saprospiraceae bacterium]
MEHDIHIIQNLLNERELSMVTMVLSQLSFRDGSGTSSDAARAVKNNLQVPKSEDHLKQQIDGIMMQALSSNPYVQNNLLPYKVLPCLISKYEAGMYYGKHVDSPLMADPMVGIVRTDLAMTLFLTDASDYEGGELCLELNEGERQIKLNRGSAIIYPASVLHRVNTINSGQRIAIITWIQCLIADIEKRKLVAQIKNIQSQLEALDPKSTTALSLLQVYSNLMKMWVEL